MQPASRKPAANPAKSPRAKPRTMDAAAVAATRDRLTLKELELSAQRNRQWGRGGPEDERGTLNQVQDCAWDQVYEFMLWAAPLPFTGAVGAPSIRSR